MFRDVSSRLQVVFFSKDRPLQLDAALRSFAWSCEDPEATQVSVLYLATSPRMEALYRRLAAEQPGITFHHERGFRETLLSMLEAAPALGFVVDDALFVRRWSARNALNALARIPEAIGLSLRLGQNTDYCYPWDREQKVPPFVEAGPGLLAFDWTRADLDFSYPLELSSSIYRAEDVGPMLAEFRYRNPNELEEALHDARSRFEAVRPVLLCGEKSIAFCAPVNAVQQAFPNRRGNRSEHTPDALARAFEEGRRIDVEAFRGHVPRGCHEEVTLPFVPRVHPRDVAEVGAEPCVSVVIPCYRQAEFLPFAVASVVRQTFTDWEIVVVDDGSPDETHAVARRLSERMAPGRLRLIRQENSGLAAARNLGIAAARGRYVLPLDCDDGIDPTYLEKTVGALEAAPSAGIAATDTATFGAQETSWCLERPFEPEVLREANVITYCSLYRREVWEVVGGYNPNMSAGYEDWDFWIGCAERGVRAVYVREPLFFYRVKPQSMITSALRRDRELRARIVLNHPTLYEAARQAEAARILAGAPLPPVKPGAFAPPARRPAGPPRVVHVPARDCRFG